ncbi:class I SAM-dependent DNA methyltransferase [Alkalihalobacillus sp. CinArs1]|uniref:class I SAM-dependent DNA methyltransferase n=1 Tax=Alkalihalobacillus sp. CinArs1 TaxID=2995314 RepID=UPI0022DCEE0B|nr:class I SAM-dependent methyltransferase [Alkalihalobacillus sp. CinArs1]
MVSYEQFSYVYDRLMEDAPYDKWLELVMNERSRGKVLDLGCGTGECSIRLAEKGYDVTAVDLSEQMLSVAHDKAMRNNVNVHLIQQDMRELETNEQYDVITIFCDSLNYVVEEDGVKSTFQRIYNHLKQDGILLFDVHSLHKINDLFVGQTFASNDEDISFIWNSFSGGETGSVEHDLSFFLETDEGLYERFDELHVQRTFHLEEYTRWLEESGFSDIKVTADFLNHTPTDTSERIFFKACKKG